MYNFTSGVYNLSKTIGFFSFPHFSSKISYLKFFVLMFASKVIKIYKFSDFTFDVTKSSLFGSITLGQESLETLL